MKKITAKIPQAGGICIKLSPTDKTHNGKKLWESDKNYYTVENGIATVAYKIPKESISVNNLTWAERFTRLRKHFGWTYKDIAQLLDCSDASLRKMVSTNTQNMGIGFKFAIIVFELCSGLSKKEDLL